MDYDSHCYVESVAYIIKSDLKVLSQIVITYSLPEFTFIATI